MFTKSKQNEIQNAIYALENKRFEIIHVRDNKDNGCFNCYAHDEFTHEDLIFSANSMNNLFSKVKEHIDINGLSIELRVNPEPIQYKQ